MDRGIPETIAREHKALHERLLTAKRSGGRTGEAAKRAAKAIHPHFLAEEEFALPPIMALHAILNDEITQDMRHIIKISEHLKRDMPRMLEAHREIGAALDELARVAQEEGKLDVVQFTRDLREHAKHEEEVLYPAAVMVGEYLKLRFAGEHSAATSGPARTDSGTPGTTATKLAPLAFVRRGMFRL